MKDQSNWLNDFINLLNKSPRMTTDFLVTDSQEETTITFTELSDETHDDTTDLVKTKKIIPHNRTLIFGTCHLKSLNLDISAHTCPNRFIKELQYVFPNTDIANVIAIPTMQFARNELVNIGDEIEVEKDRLLEKVNYFLD
jgi:hypothetical protein